MENLNHYLHNQTKCFEHFILPAKSVSEVCRTEEKLQLSASRQLMVLIKLLTHKTIMI